MSLALGVKTREGVVLAEDSRVIRSPEGMNYSEDGVSKMRMFGEGCAVAITGDVALMNLYLDRAEQERKVFRPEQSVGETILELRELFRTSYRESFPDEPNPEKHMPTTLLSCSALS